jgi:uncharacterized membrane protein YeaQ/YmgE (transglycosylase-associated protein family)
MIQGDVDFDGTTSKAGLLDIATYTYDANDEVLADIVAGIVGTAVALASKTVGVVGNGVADAADTTIVAVSGAAVGAAFTYMDGATKYLLSYNLLSAPVTPNGGDITIQWAAGGIFSI